MMGERVEKKTKISNLSQRTCYAFIGFSVFIAIAGNAVFFGGLDVKGSSVRLCFVVIHCAMQSFQVN